MTPPAPELSDDDELNDHATLNSIPRPFMMQENSQNAGNNYHNRMLTDEDIEPLGDYDDKIGNIPNMFNLKEKLSTAERNYIATHYANSCDIAAEVSIARLMLPHEKISIDDSISFLKEQGIYTPENGVSLPQVGTLLEHYGIPCEIHHYADVDLLAEKLTAGHGIMLPVDSSELYDTGILAEIKLWLSQLLGMDFGNDGADHVLMATGLDYSDPDHPMVIVYDPLKADGAGKSYPLDQFLEAWEDSNFQLIATEEPLPQPAPMPTPPTAGVTIANSPKHFFADPDAIKYL